MAKFLLAVWPFTGHVHPNIALANALKGRGHKVAFYSGAAAQTMIEREGFPYFPFQQLALHLAKTVGLPETNQNNGWDTPPLYERMREHFSATYDQSIFERSQKFKAIYRDWILGTVPEQVRDLEAILAEWQPDVLVCDPFMWGPVLILHETQLIPVAVFSYFASCLLPGPEAPPFALGLPRPHNRWTPLLWRLLDRGKQFFFKSVRHRANMMRRDFGLPPLSTPIMAFSAQMPLYLVASAPEFDYERRHLPPSVHYVGPCLWDRPKHERAPAWLDGLDEVYPVVYVTEGTAHTRAPILLRAASQGLANLPLQLVMTTGRHRDPAKLDLGTIAPNIRLKRWVSHSHLFPKTHLVVSHGGSSTVLAALQAGLPLVIVPMQWDQAENAQRVAAAGAGLRLSPRHCTPKRLQVAVKRVLEDPSFRQNAYQLAAVLKRYGGAVQAAELLTNLTETSERDRVR